MRLGRVTSEIRDICFPIAAGFSVSMLFTAIIPIGNNPFKVLRIQAIITGVMILIAYTSHSIAKYTLLNEFMQSMNDIKQQLQSAALRKQMESALKEKPIQ